MCRNVCVMLVLALLAITALLFTACQAAPESTIAPVAQATATPKEPYKIGSLSSFTGTIGSSSAEWRDGVNTVVDQINAAGGIDGHPLTVMFEDDGSDATKAATALTKLIREDKVLAVDGPGFLNILPAAMGVAEREASTPVVLGQQLPANLRAQNPKWTFTQLPTEVGSVDSIIDVLKWKGYKKVITIGDVTPLHSAAVELLKQKGPAAGIEVLATGDTFAPGDVDLSSQVSKIKQLADREKPDALVLITAAIMVPQFIKPAKQLGVDLPIIGPYLFGMQSLLGLSGDDINGIMFTGLKYLAPEALPDSDPQKALLMDFVKHYKEKSGGKDPSLNSTTAADGISIIANALKVAGPDRAKLRDAIAASNFMGLNGPINFKTRDGLPKQSLVIYQVQNKKFVLVNTIK
ncbi:MAG: ABC transporter substrate-binding protein [Chloroflexi bacterium]|nr:ABC transporter substrate-binding protein [Chloroflexota bacterium]